MILNRLGNKAKIAQKIQEYFPRHDLYIEPFFGAGGMFFNKPKAKYNILNDLDSEVFNLYNVLRHDHENFRREWEKTPYSQDLWDYWKTTKEKEPLYRAIRFVMLSNTGYMGKTDTLRFERSNTQQVVLDNIDKTREHLFACQFMNTCFSSMFKKISQRRNDHEEAFIYCDPPYLGTINNYAHSFSEEQSNELFNCLVESGSKFAVSEFDHPFILNQAKERKLNVMIIGERRNLTNRRTEILVTNYENRQMNLFD